VLRSEKQVVADDKAHKFVLRLERGEWSLKLDRQAIPSTSGKAQMNPAADDSEFTAGDIAKANGYDAFVQGELEFKYSTQAAKFDHIEKQHFKEVRFAAVPEEETEDFSKAVGPKTVKEEKASIHSKLAAEFVKAKK